MFGRKKRLSPLLSLSEDQLRELDLQLRRDGYEIDARIEKAFDRHVRPIKAEKKALNRRRSQVAIAISLAGAPEAERAAFEALLGGESDG